MTAAGMHVRVQRIGLGLLLATLLGCFRPAEVALPRGYRLVAENKTSFLAGPTGARLLGDPVSDFRVSGGYVYGWIDSFAEDFFLLDTSSGKLQVFDKWQDLDVATDKLGLPRLKMNDSYTFLDLVNGYKKATW